MINKKSVLAIIPARSGSKRLIDKNKRLFCGKPLTQWTIEAALNSQVITDIVVSTDCDDIISLSNSFDIKTIRRPNELSNDTAKIEDVIFHSINELKGETYDYIILLQPTSPLRLPTHIDEAFDQLVRLNANAIISVCETSDHPFWSNTLDDSLNMEGFIKHDFIGLRKQDLPIFYKINGAIYICNLNYFKKERRLILSQKTHAYIMSKKESIDIDEDYDFKVAQIMYQIRENN